MSIIRFDRLEADLGQMSKEFKNNQPYEHIYIDDFCDSIALRQAVLAIPDPSVSNVNKSRDFIFAKNKYEKAEFAGIHIGFQQLYEDLMSDRFCSFLNALTGEDVFVDPAFHGGGLHQGGMDSFLNMHVDFNYHPNHCHWFRNLNILLYLNQNWKESYGGELKLIDGRSEDRKLYKIEPLFNRAVIMFTRNYTLHGYDRINFPLGQYRRSIAAYAYSQVAKPKSSEVRTTTWFPEDAGLIKTFLGKNMPYLVKIKRKLLGSSTNRNK